MKIWVRIRLKVRVEDHVRMGDLFWARVTVEMKVRSRIGCGLAVTVRVRATLSSGDTLPHSSPKSKHSR